MQKRVLILRNVLKAWLLLASCRAALRPLGWQLGGYRLGLLFFASVVMLGGGGLLVRRPDRDGHARRTGVAQGEAPALHSTLERLAARRA